LEAPPPRRPPAGIRRRLACTYRGEPRCRLLAGESSDAAALQPCWGPPHPQRPCLEGTPRRHLLTSRGPLGTAAASRWPRTVSPAGGCRGCAAATQFCTPKFARCCYRGARRETGPRLAAGRLKWRLEQRCGGGMGTAGRRRLGAGSGDEEERERRSSDGEAKRESRAWRPCVGYGRVLDI
jgi:hypothetical protein